MRKIKKQILKFLQRIINNKNRKRLIQKNRSIIANNCIGGFISHYLGIQFQSPTVNLFIKPKDYIKMLLDFDKYFDPKAPINEVKFEGINYPVGELYGAEIHFMHYKSFDEAVAKWRERCCRINKDCLYIMMTDRDGCTLEDMKSFDSLDYKNKVIFTNRQYPEIKSAFYIRGFEKENPWVRCRKQ